jgi:hypothetical protein
MEFRIDMDTFIYIYKERERLGYGLDDRASASGGAVISIIYAVACGTAVGSSFPRALTLRLKRLGVKLTTHLHLVPRLLYGVLFN